MACTRVVGASDYSTRPFDPRVLGAKVILAGLGAWLSRLETTVPRLEDGLAGASRAEPAGIAAEPAGIAAELADQVCGPQPAAYALTQAHQVGDRSVGVLPPDACAR